MIPPILRTYSDLDPGEILVGDQHRFDFWVVDEETGELFRPECYIFWDLRTRLAYGGAVAKKYDSQLMGLALRIGVKFFGLFKGIYTDNGKPELSNHIESIVKDIPECKHTKAKVRNAKAKPAEGNFAVTEGIMRDDFLLPGYVKSLKDPKERQDVDEKEIRKLADSGKLLTFKEFVIVFYNALGYYNNQKSHRGVLKEWKWKPVPKEATPLDCLNQCISDGWKPTTLSDDAIDLLFLAREKQPRTVDRGRISFKNEVYEHEKLIPLHGQKVCLKYDPFDLEQVLVFHEEQYLCRAELVEYSSMKDKTLAGRKIAEKARLRKEFTQQYRKVTSLIPDIRQSSTSRIEEVAALVSQDKADKVLTDQERYRTRTQDELESEILKLEEFEKKRKPTFFNISDRYKWCIDQLYDGEELSEEDKVFYEEYSASLNQGMQEYWALYRNSRMPVNNEGDQHVLCSNS